MIKRFFMFFLMSLALSVCFGLDGPPRGQQPLSSQRDYLPGEYSVNMVFLEDEDKHKEPDYKDLLVLISANYFVLVSKHPSTNKTHGTEGMAFRYSITEADREGQQNKQTMMIMQNNPSGRTVGFPITQAKGRKEGSDEIFDVGIMIEFNNATLILKREHNNPPLYRQREDTYESQYNRLAGSSKIRSIEVYAGGMVYLSNGRIDFASTTYYEQHGITCDLAISQNNMNGPLPYSKIVYERAGRYLICNNASPSQPVDISVFYPIYESDIVLYEESVR
jgi:hypothetical protein